ncbi:MAG: NAD-dependent epimerase/dehydratase family protein [Acetobacteraceae bacterium]|nr:NAD-dependent epimerase/dehydratase family protein [Acetobacteraceae bacterium]
MAHFAVTGAAGFIGSHLVDALLAEGHTVRGLDDLSTGREENLDERCDLIVGDVTDPVMVREVMRDADGCFHLAAIASVARANQAWVETHRVNQTGTVTVLDAARGYGRVPVVYASSAAVYGDVGTGRAHEDLLAAPLTAYGADKLASEFHARVGFLVHRVPSMGLRFFNVYGPRQDPLSPYSGVISIFARRVGRNLPVRVYGTGEQVRDFVYVRDVVAHLLAAMSRLRSTAEVGVLNVCTGLGTSVLRLARILGEVQGREPAIDHHDPRPGDIRVSIGDPSLARSVLGLSAGVSLRDGLSETIAYLARDHRTAAEKAGD